MRFKDWIGPVLTVLVPLCVGGVHLEMEVAKHQAVDQSILQRLDRIERMLDTQRLAMGD